MSKKSFLNNRLNKAILSISLVTILSSFNCESSCTSQEIKPEAIQLSQPKKTNQNPWDIVEVGPNYVISRGGISIYMSDHSKPDTILAKEYFKEAYLKKSQ